MPSPPAPSIWPSSGPTRCTTAEFFRVWLLLAATWAVEVAQEFRSPALARKALAAAPPFARRDLIVLCGAGLSRQARHRRVLCWLTQGLQTSPRSAYVNRPQTARCSARVEKQRVAFRTRALAGIRLRAGWGWPAFDDRSRRARPGAFKAWLMHTLSEGFRDQKRS